MHLEGMQFFNLRLELFQKINKEANKEGLMAEVFHADILDDETLLLSFTLVKMHELD